MQRNINRLIDYRMRATDGEIGKVEDFYFEDDSWKIRYLIVRTGGWLFGHKVLISPAALVKTAWETESFPVGLTREQIRKSPLIDTDKPVYRQQESELHAYYSWPGYWEGGLYAYGAMGAASFRSAPDAETGKETDKADAPNYDLHLRSTHKITGYHIHATDGDLGHVTDFIMDDRSWQILFLVVDTHNWLGGKKVLIAVSHIKKMEWEHSKVYIDLSVAAIKNSRAYDAVEYIHPGDDNTIHGNSNIHLK
jgi:uncharacterized protein YrrD